MFIHHFQQLIEFNGKCSLDLLSHAIKYGLLEILRDLLLRLNNPFICFRDVLVRVEVIIVILLVKKLFDILASLPVPLLN